MLLPRITFALLLAALASGCGERETSGSPFVCNLNALDGAEREQYSELSRALAVSIEDLRELPDGYSFRLSNALPLSRAAQWSELEARCCPFFDIRLEQTREHGPLWLHLTGRDGVKQFIREEFGL